MIRRRCSGRAPEARGQRGAFGLLQAAGVLSAAWLLGCSATANVSDVFMSLDEDGLRPRKVFFTDSKNVTCIAEVASGRDNVTFQLLLRRVAEAPFASDQFEATNKVILAQEFNPGRTDGPMKLALTMKPSTFDAEGKPKEDDDAPFTPGSYVCEVYLDGVKKDQAAFNVDYPDCPTVMIQPGTPCAGFYTTGTECPAAGATGDPDPTCACAETGWECR